MLCNSSRVYKRQKITSNLLRKADAYLSAHANPQSLFSDTSFLLRVEGRTNCREAGFLNLVKHWCCARAWTWVTGQPGIRSSLQMLVSPIPGCPITHVHTLVMLTYKCYTGAGARSVVEYCNRGASRYTNEVPVLR